LNGSLNTMRLGRCIRRSHRTDDAPCAGPGLPTRRWSTPQASSRSREALEPTFASPWSQSCMDPAPESVRTSGRELMYVNGALYSCSPEPPSRGWVTTGVRWRRPWRVLDARDECVEIVVSGGASVTNSPSSDAGSPPLAESSVTIVCHVRSIQGELSSAMSVVRRVPSSFAREDEDGFAGGVLSTAEDPLTTWGLARASRSVIAPVAGCLEDVRTSSDTYVTTPLLSGDLRLDAVTHAATTRLSGR